MSSDRPVARKNRFPLTYSPNLCPSGNGGLSEEFKYYFENIHPSFFKNLAEAFPSLTPRDLRLCALLRMGLSTKEIADITFRETRSVESARNRLRKKCNLSQQEDFTKFFSKY